MNICRICRTKTNLKYVPEQLAKTRKKPNANGKQEIMDANATILGNICFECEGRLLNFHKLDEQQDMEADSGREETPVIVDDDDLFYNLFFENAKQAELMLKLERPKNSLSSDCDTEVIELPSSREISPNLEKIVAVIDLSDDSLSRTATDTSAVATPTKKRKRHKKYDEKQLVVLAKLNLVSSDSEEDEIYPPAKRHTSYDHTAEETSVAIEINNATNNISSIQKIEVEHELRTESTVRDRVHCFVCQSVFSCNQRLVHHMRIRHRDNEQETHLRERMRHAQDSALTIRLCFHGRYLYYECQMCGRIDCIFKEHKEHVIAKHSSELISLKDPLLKRLPCPVCQQSCGSLYIEVCRHLLQAHTFMQYKFYMKEINCEQDEELKVVTLTARIYKFHQRVNLYFLCRQCEQLNTSINSHRKHVKEKHRSKAPTADLQVQKQRVRSLRAKQKKQINVETTETTKPVRYRKQSAKLKDSTCDFIIPRSRQKKDHKLVKTSVKKCVGLQEPKRGRGRRPAAEHLPRVRVKVKPPIKQIPTPSYNCQYCKTNFEGFLLWNLHNLKDHSVKLWTYTFEDKLNIHKVKPYNIHHRSKRNKASSDVDENSNTTKAISMQKCLSIKAEEIEVDNVTSYVPSWLAELFEMHESKRAQRQENEDREILFSSGLMEMKPNTAILEQTSNIRCIKKYNIATHAT